MDVRKVRESLGRVRTSFQRNETRRALAFFISGLQSIGNSTTPPEVRGDIREAVQLLARDEQIRKHFPGGQNTSYTPGQEKALLQLVTQIHDMLVEAEGKESPEEALARKIKIDQTFNAGKKLMEQGKASEADASFAEAVQSYKDEHRLFYMIAKLLVDAEEVVRAGHYLKKGLEVLPDDPDLMALLERARVLRQAMKGR
jgi:predicted Zn-dependent protease